MRHYRGAQRFRLSVGLGIDQPEAIVAQKKANPAFMRSLHFEMIRKKEIA